MREWKKVVAFLGIIVFVGRGFLTFFMYGEWLDDPEFEQALVRAEQTGIENVQYIKEYPFEQITREKAASWYIAFAQDVGLLPNGESVCDFVDISDYSQDSQEKMTLMCRYEFFKGVTRDDGVYYHPDIFLTKAASLVAIMRGVYPKREFGIIEPYREPFVNEAYKQGITKRVSTPYLMYNISQYELLLQLWRMKQSKTDGLAD